MRYFDQNESTAARRDVFVQMLDADDYVTPKTGASLTVEIVKAGASSYASIAGSAAEIGSGTYKIGLASGDLDTEGEAMVKVSAAGAVTQYVPIRVRRLETEMHLIKAALVNQREHTVSTGVDVIKDDDGTTTLRTLTPSESEGVVTLTPS